MRTLSIVWAALALFMLSEAGAQGSEVAPEKARAIAQLMQTTGAMSIGKQFADSMLAQLKPLFQNVPDSFWQELAKEFENTEELTALIIPIYDRHLSLSEIEELIQFYSTPLGRKLVSVLPAITQDSILVGQRWGELKAQQVIQRLNAAGYSQSL